VFKLIICLLTEQNNIYIDLIGLDHIHLHTFIRESKKCTLWKYKKKKERNKQNRYGYNSKTNNPKTSYSKEVMYHLKIK